MQDTITVWYAETTTWLPDDFSLVTALGLLVPHVRLKLTNSLLCIWTTKSGKPQSFVGFEESYADKEAKYPLLGVLNLYTLPGEKESKQQTEQR